MNQNAKSDSFTETYVNKLLVVTDQRCIDRQSYHSSFSCHCWVIVEGWLVMHADHWIRSPHHHTHWPRAVDKLAATNKVEPQIPAGGRIPAQSHRLNTQYWLNTGPTLTRWPSIEPALDHHPALFYRHVATGMHTPRYRQAGCERIRIWRSRMGDMHPGFQWVVAVTQSNTIPM